MLVCQSCGMPLKKDQDFGTNADASKSSEYCSHCFQGGSFTEPHITLPEMRQKSQDIMHSEMRIPRFLARLFTMNMKNLARWKA